MCNILMTEPLVYFSWSKDMKWGHNKQPNNIYNYVLTKAKYIVRNSFLVRTR